MPWCQAPAVAAVPAQVVGHTIQRGINSACQGRVYRVDVGMSKVWHAAVQGAVLLRSAAALCRCCRHYVQEQGEGACRPPHEFVCLRGCAQPLSTQERNPLPALRFAACLQGCGNREPEVLEIIDDSQVRRITTQSAAAAGAAAPPEAKARDRQEQGEEQSRPGPGAPEGGVGRAAVAAG